MRYNGLIQMVIAIYWSVFMKKRYFVLLCLFFVTRIVCALPVHTLTIAVASNFESTFKALQPVFEKKYHVKLNPAFGSTGQLYTQIINGAPFDVFLSGDKAHVSLLNDKKRAISSNQFVYAIGELVVYAPGRSISNTGLTNALLTPMKHIAIANPAIAPYGLAAKQYLKRAHLLAGVKNKLVVGENIGQVATFLMTRNVDAGFIANSQLMDIIIQSRRHIDSAETWIVPQTMYDPLTQYATLIESSRTKHDAKLFLAFLKSTEAKKMIVQHGYHFSNDTN